MVPKALILSDKKAKGPSITFAFHLARIKRERTEEDIRIIKEEHTKAFSLIILEVPNVVAVAILNLHYKY